MISFVLGGLCVFIIVVNLVIVVILCKYAKDGYDALFASSVMKYAIKICGCVQMSFVKIFTLPLLMILVSIPICTTDKSQVLPS